MENRSQGKHYWHGNGVTRLVSIYLVAMVNFAVMYVSPSLDVAGCDCALIAHFIQFVCGRVARIQIHGSIHSNTLIKSNEHIKFCGFLISIPAACNRAFSTYFLFIINKYFLFRNFNRRKLLLTFCF